MKISAFCICFILAILNSFGQEDLDKLKAPSSPAASVLGIQPTTILNPKSYEALETSLFSNYLSSDGNVLMPNDLGIEFTPYWATDRRMTTKEYLFPKPKESFVRNMSFSLASTQNYILHDTINSNALGLGFRTTIYFTDKVLKDKITMELDSLIKTKRIKDIMLNVSAEFILLNDTLKNTQDFIDWYVKELKRQDAKWNLFEDKLGLERTTAECAAKLKAELPKYSSDSKNDFLQEVNQILDDFWDVAAKRERIGTFAKDRPGLKMEIASALSIDFPTNKFDFGLVPQKSIWLTPSYTFKGNTSVVKLLGVLRYNSYNLDFYTNYSSDSAYFKNNVDFGGALELSFKKFKFQIECIGRASKTIIDESIDSSGVTTTRSVQQDDFQYVGTFSYQIKDNVIITYNLGEQFEPILNYKGTLISMLSLNFGFGGPTSDVITD